jgi:hypothetical protein
MDAHPEFERSLKVVNPDFVLLNGLIISYLPPTEPRHVNQVIGFWYLDTKRLLKGTPPFFKQDMVVLVGGTGGTFVSYAAKQFVAPPTVELIDDFYRDYSAGGLYYIRNGHKKPWVHHFDDVSDLPPELQADAQFKKQACLAGLPVVSGA